MRTKLALAFFAVALLALWFLFGYFGPLTESGFVARSEPLIEKSASAMRELAELDIENSERVLVDLIRHSVDSRRRALADIPLSLYGGDVARIRRAIDEHDAARAERLMRNVRVLGDELHRRADARIDDHVATLTVDQRASSQAFAESIRTSFLVGAIGLLVALIVFLGFGLDRLVVRPIHRLRAATRRVADGDLRVEIGAGSRDELGDLAGDFGVMLERLRASQAEIREKNEELERWNSKLRDEVSRKTEHLEDALQNLQATQAKLLHADKMAALGTLAGGVAHEFNNLIGGIRGCIADALEDEADAQRREPLEVARRATERAGEVTAKLLRFARPRIEGRESVGIQSVVGDVVELVDSQARRQGVAVEVDIRDDHVVFVNPGEMHQVFLNLFTNALQAMPDDGGRLRVVSRADDGFIEVDVEDDGAGIEPADLPHVFDPFFSSKAHGATTRGPLGAGLGLSVSFGIVEAHGGVLSVRSEPGVGTTFTVRLPVGRAEGDS